MIADSIELVAGAHMFDAMVCIVGCDKTTPGAAMALARLDVPAVILYSGTIAPGHFRGQAVASGMCSRRSGPWRRPMSGPTWPSWSWRPARDRVPAAASTPPTPCR